MGLTDRRKTDKNLADSRKNGIDLLLLRKVLNSLMVAFLFPG